MKTTHFYVKATLICVAAFSISQMAPVAPSTTPCLCLSNDLTCPTTASRETVDTTITHDFINARLVDNPVTLERNPGAAYKAFWIWGDGNFTFEPFDDLPAMSQSRTQTYTYAQNGKYTPIAFLTESKSNDEPPRMASRTIDFQPSTRTQPNAEFVRRLTGAATADILACHLIRPSYPTAFAVSVPRDSFISEILFFYNGKQDANGNITKTQFLKPSMTTTEEQKTKPSYFASPGILNVARRTPESLNVEGSGSFTSTFINALKDKFLNCFRYSINTKAYSSLPANVSELRTFPILTTDYPGQGISQEPPFFLVIAAGSRPLNPQLVDLNDNNDDVILLNNSNRISGPSPTDPSAALRPLVKKYLPGIDTNSFQIADGLYIRAIGGQSVSMIGSHDPNTFEVKQVCPTEDGKFKIDFRLEVCNDGSLFEDSIPVQLIDHSKSFGGLQFASGSKISNVAQGTAHEWTFKWDEFWKEVTVAPGGHYEPHCHEVNFSMTGDWAAIQKLTTRGALEICSTFPKGNGVPAFCQLNVPIEASELDPKLGYKCGEGGEKCPWWQSLWCILLGIFGFLLLLLLTLKKKIFGKK